MFGLFLFNFCLDTYKIACGADPWGKRSEKEAGGGLCLDSKRLAVTVVIPPLSSTSWVNRRAGERNCKLEG